MKAIPIWGDSVPYNRPDVRKQDIMCIKKWPKGVAMIAWMRSVFGSKIDKDASALDTFTYLDEILPGKVSACMDDMPSLTHYPAEGSDMAVIVVPGGGFCNQSRDYEGESIARFLNSCGITAFVLEYRMNPYEAPVFYLDLQRAIRFVRFHAEEYHISPDRIGAIGFSAGGYITGAAALLLPDTPPEAPGYTPDEVDLVSGRANSIGLLYPVTHFDDNPNMLCLVGGDDFFDPAKRAALEEKYSLIVHAGDAPDIPQFLCYGTKDMLKGNDRYAAALDQAGVPHKTITIDGANHGFSLRQKNYAWWADEYVKWLEKVM